MKRVCAWCKKEFSPKDSQPQSAVVTHGICDACRAFFESNTPKPLHAFLNGFPAPILCMDGNARVIAANEAACTLLGRSHDEVAQVMCGDVIQCRWARLPGGCGQTEHCLGCTVRLLVEQIMDSGQSLIGQPAHFERKHLDGTVKRTNLVVSAERQGDLVLMRIDQPEDLAG